MNKQQNRNEVERVRFRIYVDGKQTDYRTYPAATHQQRGDMAARCLTFYRDLYDTSAVELIEVEGNLMTGQREVMRWTRSDNGYTVGRPI